MHNYLIVACVFYVFLIIKFAWWDKSVSPGIKQDDDEVVLIPFVCFCVFSNYNACHVPIN